MPTPFSFIPATPLVINRDIPAPIQNDKIPAPSTISIQDGQDYFIENDAQLPYKLIKNLGHGHSARVEMVEDTNTGFVYARKVFRICGTRDERKLIFENEIKVIRRLAPHHHVVRVFATYVAKREVGVILHPVADAGDLEAFLEDFIEANARESLQIGKIRILESSFGCLASGLAFMHGQKIRHKDIKPRNILIHQDSMIYTDFGYSLDHGSAAQSTTSGRPDTFTRKYCAPEVNDWEPRNSKSDVFSLGCVFLEILSALSREFKLPSHGKCYYESIESIQRQLQKSAPP
ncbi:kinase-like protein, partial [Zopfia rhizophila CBS 207.26]